MDETRQQKRVKLINDYNKKYTKTVLIRLNCNNDKDIIEQLDKVDSKMGYIIISLKKVAWPPGGILKMMASDIIHQTGPW